MASGACRFRARWLLSGRGVHPVVRLELRPRDVRPFNVLVAESKDIRSLGVALTRIRRGGC